MKETYSPPAYCPNAVATNKGWVNPRNGELLVSIKNLSQKIANQPVVVPEPVAIIPEVVRVELVPEPIIEVPEGSIVIELSDDITITEAVGSEPEVQAQPEPEVQPVVVAEVQVQPEPEVQPEPVVKPKRKGGRPKKGTK